MLNCYQDRSTRIRNCKILDSRKVIFVNHILLYSTISPTRYIKFLAIMRVSFQSMVSKQNSITFARLQMKELFYSPIFSIHQMDVSLILVALFRNFSTRKGEKTFRQKSNCFTCQKSRKWKQNFLFPSAKVLSGKLYPRCNQYDDASYFLKSDELENHQHQVILTGK